MFFFCWNLLYRYTLHCSVRFMNINSVRFFFTQKLNQQLTQFIWLWCIRYMLALTLCTIHYSRMKIPLKYLAIWFDPSHFWWPMSTVILTQNQIIRWYWLLVFLHKITWNEKKNDKMTKTFCKNKMFHTFISLIISILDGNS